jgi:hypothetical protein
MGPNVLTLTLAIPLHKGTRLALGVRLTPRSKILWIWASTSAALNSSEEGWSGQLGPRYVHILVLRLWSGRIRRLKNIHRRCIPVNPSCHSYQRFSHKGCNLSRSFLATPSPQEGRGMGRPPVNIGSGAEPSFLR